MPKHINIFFEKSLRDLRIKLDTKKKIEAEEKLTELFKILLDIHK